MPVFGVEVYPDLHVKAAVLLGALNRNHPLLDGNKRLSWVTTLAFCEINGMDSVVESQADIDRFIRRVAADQVPPAGIAGWLGEHPRPFGTGAD